MEKPLYNQGDLLQFQRSRDTEPQLFVITEVYTNYLDVTYYTTAWIAEGEKEVYDINTLDDSVHITLLARGQQ